VATRLLRGVHNPGLIEAAAEGCVATIGNFDGVHIGHQAIFKQVTGEAHKRKLRSVVIIFEPQPLEYFKEGDAPVRLMRFREKFHAISEHDLDYVFCLKFDTRLSQLSAKGFVEQILVSHLNVKHLVIGDDFRFGGDRSGDYSLLQEMGDDLGFTVESTQTIACEESSQRASSTLIRDFLAQSDFKKAEKALGRPYGFFGKVIHGQKLGRQLGFPTANVALKRAKVPFTGVYVVSLFLDGEEATSYPGVANVGVKPTVGNFLPSLEVHLLDFKQDIYGRNVQVVFHQKVRGEQRFDGIEALKEQIEKDALYARAYFDRQN
jgi:riboflavin kinase/FMN adenylyltransferase